MLVAQPSFLLARQLKLSRSEPNLITESTLDLTKESERKDATPVPELPQAEASTAEIAAKVYQTSVSRRKLLLAFHEAQKSLKMPMRPIKLYKKEKLLFTQFKPDRLRISDSGTVLNYKFSDK